MNSAHSLQALLNNTATEEDIELLKHLLASGEISIGGNVNQSVIIIGSGNTVELPPAALDRLNARPMLGNLDRDLTGEEIATGLRRLDKLLPNRAPILLPHYKEQVGRLRPTLKTEIKVLSASSRRERVEALAAINSICVEALDVSFNGLALGEEAPKYDARSPFRGLESFRPEDSEFFFGREALTQKLVGKIKAHSFLAVLGASGSGKSSLVMAGVIPVLDLDYVIFRPGTKPLDELESARGKSLIVVDQFEELFTLTRDESTRKEFIARLLDESTRARIILTLRSDFLGEVGAYRTLNAEIQNHLEIIPPMDMDELCRAMEGQASVVGLRFEADLSQQILDDVAGEPGAMPLLQHALWELWNRRHGRNLRASEYRAFGGVKQAITSTAEKVYADCSKPEQDQLRDIFLRLTRLDAGDEGRDTRRRVPLDDLVPSRRMAASITLLLDKLANARLLVKTVNDDKTEVEVAHEALIRRWERLRIWLNEDRDNLRLRESVSESAKEWDRSGRHETLLNSRWVKLEEALLLSQDSRYRLTEVEQVYLNGCVALRNREQRERERRLRYTMFASIVAAVMFFALGSFGLSKSNEATARANDAATAQANAEIKKLEAEQQAQIALARQLAAQGQSIISFRNSKQQTSVLLAIQSMKLFPTLEAAQFLQTNTLASPINHKTYNDSINTVAFSPDGKFIISGSWSDDIVTMWEITTGKEIFHMNHNDSISAVVYSPDGKYAVSGSWDNTARVWDTSTGTEIVRMLHDEGVRSVAFSPDGEFIVTGSFDNTVRVWETLTGNEVAKMFHDDNVISVAFSPDGKYIVSGSLDRTVRIWEIASEIEISRMPHDNDVYSVTYSPSGKYVLSSSADHTARVWDVTTGVEISRISHDNRVESAVFSVDEKYALSASTDRTARVWDIATGIEISRMVHDNSVNSIAFSFDGKYVVSGSQDGTARLWESTTGLEIARMSHNSSVNSVDISPYGGYVVSGSSDGAVHVWKAATDSGISQMNQNTGVEITAFSYDGVYFVSGGQDGTACVWNVEIEAAITCVHHDDKVVSVDFSPDGKFIVTGSLDGTVGVWEGLTGVEIAKMRHDLDVYSVAFSPNGKYIVSGSVDRTARVWDANSGAEITRVTHGYYVTSVAFSPDGKYVVSASGADGVIFLWEATTGNIITRMDIDFQVALASGETYVAFSPDGNYIVSGSWDGIVRVWETGTGKIINRIYLGSKENSFSISNNVSAVAFSQDSRYVISANTDKTARIWDVITGAEIAQLTHDDSVRSIAISPDSRYIVSGSEDGTARVWEANTGKEIARMVHGDDVASVIFSPDGRYILSSSIDHTIWLWIYRPEDLIANACSRVVRNLTSNEWQQYIGDALPYQAICPNLPIEPESTSVP